MLRFKYVIWAIALIIMTGCKTSPSTDEIAVPNSASIGVPSSQSEEIVTSSVAADESTVPAQVEAYNVVPGEFNLYPRDTNGWDKNGWSLISPSKDSRLIYVSSSTGDDDTAEVYALREVRAAEDPGRVKPFKTISAAMNSAREGYPDWVLLLKGDVWEVDYNTDLKAGRSVTERSVFGSYGVVGSRPIVKVDSSAGLTIWVDKSNIVVRGITFYAYKRDPESSDFIGWGSVEDSIGIRIYSKKGSVRGSILFEGNDLNYFSKGIEIAGKGDVLDMVVRRNSIRNSYSEKSHSQGISATHVSMLLEENVFDHNGWYKQQVGGGNEMSEGQATMFNHNTYFSNSYNTQFIRNIFLRSSSIQNKWTAEAVSDSKTNSIKSYELLMEDNVYVGGEIGISAGGNLDYGTGPRWKDISIKNNVMLGIGRDQPTNRNLGWSIDANDWDGGLICGNYLLHTDNALVNNLYGVKLSGHSNRVAISENTIHGLIMPRPEGHLAAIAITDEPKADIIISKNNVQLRDSKMHIIVADQLDSIVFRDNIYLSSLDREEWFGSLGEVYDIEEWRLRSGDNNSTVGPVSFLEPKRTFETYLLSIGLSGSIDEFSAHASNQSEGNWNADLTAPSILRYIREAYGDLECSQ